MAEVTAKKSDQMPTLHSEFRTSRGFALSYRSHQRLVEIVAEGDGHVAERTSFLHAHLVKQAMGSPLEAGDPPDGQMPEWPN